MDFSPFDILPDSCAPIVADSGVEYLVPVQAVPVRVIPASLVGNGNNGNNLPANIGEGIHRELAKRREGRMSQFTEEKAATVIEGIEDGLTMVEIAQSMGHERKIIWTWMQLSPEFADAVAQAREYQGHASADQAVNILDDVVIDPDNPKAAMAELRKAEQRSRIRMQLAECFNFKQYGSKKQTLNLNLNAEVSPVDLSRY